MIYNGCTLQCAEVQLHCLGPPVQPTSCICLSTVYFYRCFISWKNGCGPMLLVPGWIMLSALGCLGLFCSKMRDSPGLGLPDYTGQYMYNNVQCSTVSPFTKSFHTGLKHRTILCPTILGDVISDGLQAMDGKIHPRGVGQSDIFIHTLPCKTSLILRQFSTKTFQPTLVVRWYFHLNFFCQCVLSSCYNISERFLLGSTQLFGEWW